MMLSCVAYTLVILDSARRPLFRPFLVLALVAIGSLLIAGAAQAQAHPQVRAGERYLCGEENQRACCPTESDFIADFNIVGNPFEVGEPCRQFNDGQPTGLVEYFPGYDTGACTTSGRRSGR